MSGREICKKTGVFYIQIMNGYSFHLVCESYCAPMLWIHPYNFHYLIKSLLGANAIKKIRLSQPPSSFQPKSSHMHTHTQAHTPGHTHTRTQAHTHSIKIFF